MKGKVNFFPFLLQTAYGILRQSDTKMNSGGSVKITVPVSLLD